MEDFPVQKGSVRSREANIGWRGSKLVGISERGARLDMIRGRGGIRAGWVGSLGGVRCCLLRVVTWWVCSSLGMRWVLEHRLHFKCLARVGRRVFLVLCRVGRRGVLVGSQLSRIGPRLVWRLGVIRGYSSSRGIVKSDRSACGSSVGWPLCSSL